MWADDWHFKREGMELFADEFAKSLVAHLRNRGGPVEGLGP